MFTIIQIPLAVHADGNVPFNPDLAPSYGNNRTNKNNINTPSANVTGG